MRSIWPSPITILINFKQMYILWQSSGMRVCYFFSETWLCNKISDDSMCTDGFGLPISTDRNKIGTGKSQGGWVCLYMNEWWCDRSSLTVRKWWCTADIELLSVSLRPTYLPHEFGHAILFTVVHVPPSANAVHAASEITDTVHALQMISPADDLPNFILRDFNLWNLRSSLPTFKGPLNTDFKSSISLTLYYIN